MGFNRMPQKNHYKLVGIHADAYDKLQSFLSEMATAEVAVFTLKDIASAGVKLWLEQNAAVYRDMIAARDAVKARKVGDD